MSTPSAKLMVMVGQKFACIKVIGRANFSSSIDFKTLLTELRQKGYNYFVLDLSECALMDSTFLGVLAGFGIKMSPPKGEECSQGIELFKPNARISELLENLGVLHLFRITDGTLPVPDGAEAQEHAACAHTKAEVSLACLEAHRTLMEVSPGNVSKFKDVAQFLADDLKRLKGEG